MDADKAFNLPIEMTLMKFLQLIMFTDEYGLKNSEQFVLVLYTGKMRTIVCFFWVYVSLSKWKGVEFTDMGEEQKQLARANKMRTTSTKYQYVLKGIKVN